MSIEENQQLSLQFNSGVNAEQEEKKIDTDDFSKGKPCVVRSIVKELTEKEKTEESKIFGNILSRINHLLR